MSCLLLLHVLLFKPCSEKKPLMAYMNKTDKSFQSLSSLLLGYVVQKFATFIFQASDNLAMLVISRF